MSVHPLEGPWVASRGWQLRMELPPPSCAGFCGGVCSCRRGGPQGVRSPGRVGRAGFILGETTKPPSEVAAPPAFPAAVPGRSGRSRPRQTVATLGGVQRCHRCLSFISLATWDVGQLY